MAERLGESAWLAALDDLVVDLLKRWDLVVERSHSEGASSSLILFVRRRDEPLVLKIAIPHHEASFEHIGLRAWEGRGAVLLVEFDASGAMLLERAEPGTPLAKLPDPDEAARIGGALIPRLQCEPTDASLDSLAENARRWAADARERIRRLGAPEDIALVDEGAELLEVLSLGTTDLALLHGDFHHWNILAAKREPWLAIDTKPLVGDPIFDAGQFFVNHQWIYGREHLARGFDVFAEAAEIDPRRVRLWGFAKATEVTTYQVSVGDAVDMDGLRQFRDLAR